MKRIILHYSAGVCKPCKEDRQAYHYVVGIKDGVQEGMYTPYANEDCSDKIYARHCGGGNTGAIGVAVCGYYGYKSPEMPGHYIPDRTQFERMFKLVAQLMIKYNIPLVQVETHAEFGLKNPSSASAVKIDFSYIPDHWGKGEIIGIQECGDFIRGKIKWYLERLIKEQDHD